MQLSWLAGGWHGRERCGFHGFQEAGLRLWTDNSGNRLSPSGSSLVAANLRLAGLRYVSEFPGAEGFSSVLGNKARRRPLFAVSIAPSKLIKPSELRAVDGVFRLH